MRSIHWKMTAKTRKKYKIVKSKYHLHPACILTYILLYLITNSYETISLCSFLSLLTCTSALFLLSLSLYISSYFKFVILPFEFQHINLSLWKPFCSILIEQLIILCSFLFSNLPYSVWKSLNCTCIFPVRISRLRIILITLRECRHAFNKANFDLNLF